MTTCPITLPADLALKVLDCRSTPWAAASFTGASHRFAIEYPAGLRADVISALREGISTDPARIIADAALTGLILSNGATETSVAEVLTINVGDPA